MLIMIIIIIIIIFSLQSTVGKSSRRQMLQSRLAAIQKLILAHRVLKIALMNSFVLCQPTNAAARRLCRRLCRPPHRHLSQVCIMFAKRPFYRYGCHIEFIRFKEYYGMPRGHSLSIHARFSGKKRTSLYIFISGKRRSLLNPNTAQRSFFPITIFFQENLKKNWS